MDYLIARIRYIESLEVIEDAVFADELDALETENLELERVGL